MVTEVKVPGYDVMKAFELAHFSLAELAAARSLLSSMPRRVTMTPDDSTLTADDYSILGYILILFHQHENGIMR